MTAPSLAQIAAFLHKFGYPVLLATLVLVALVLVVLLVRAVRRGRADRWVSNVAGVAVLALSAEGMWAVAREKLHLPALLAACVFFVAEAAMLSSAMQANRHQARHIGLRMQAEAATGPERDRLLGEARRWNPAKHARAVWIIAAGAGVIVSLNSHSLVEVPLRLALPLLAAYLWWNSLTDGGVTRDADPSSWRWTPRRLLLWIGAIEAGERDAVEINRERRIGAMTTVARRLHRGGPLHRVHESRLERLALAADAGMVREVRERVDRVCRIKELTAPTRPVHERVDAQGDARVGASGDALDAHHDARVDAVRDALTVHSRTASTRTTRRAPRRGTERVTGAWWTASRERVYTRYATRLDAGQGEMTADEMRTDLGVETSGGARNVRDHKMRTRYAREVVDGARAPRDGAQLPNAIAGLIAAHRARELGPELRVMSAPTDAPESAS